MACRSAEKDEGRLRKAKVDYEVVCEQGQSESAKKTTYGAYLGARQAARRTQVYCFSARVDGVKDGRAVAPRLMSLSVSRVGSACIG